MWQALSSQLGRAWSHTGWAVEECLGKAGRKEEEGVVKVEELGAT